MFLGLPRPEDIGEVLRKHDLRAVEIAMPLDPGPLPKAFVENTLLCAERLDTCIMLHDALPLALASGDASLRARIRARMRETLRLAADANARSVTLHTTTTRAVRPMSPDWEDPSTLWLARVMESELTDDVNEAKSVFLSLLDEIAPIARDCGLTIAVENNFRDTRYFGERIDSISDILELVRAADSPAVGVCFDVYKAAGMESSIPGAIRDCAGLLLDVHVSDFEPTDTSIGVRRLPIGAGRIEWRPALRALEDIRYDGPLIMEMVGSEDDLRASRKFLDTLRA